LGGIFRITDLTFLGYKAELSKRPPTEGEVNMLLHSTKAQIKLFRGNTLESLPRSVPSLPLMDFIFIDGGHSVETIQSDWNEIQKLIGEKTVVIFDDYWRNRIDAGCKSIVDSIDKSMYEVTILPEVDIFDNKDFGRLEISFARIVKK
jgi:Methyltransferase domain